MLDLRLVKSASRWSVAVSRISSRVTSRGRRLTDVSRRLLQRAQQSSRVSLHG